MSDDSRPRTAGAFDIRTVIGTLLGLYGVILLVTRLVYGDEGGEDGRAVLLHAPDGKGGASVVAPAGGDRPGPQAARFLHVQGVGEVDRVADVVRHHVDLAALCAATRTPHWRVDSLAELRHALASPAGGIEVVEAVVRRDDRRALDARVRALATTR